MKFSYGICDFYRIITEGYFYIDRTDRIPLIEEAGKHILFLRPRGFGKSLLLSMLENYYDVAKADEFDRLFGALAIGKNPTPEHNRYTVMNWDFSAVISQGEPEQIQQSLHSHINGCIEQFKVRYRDIVEYDIRIDEHDALRSFQSVLAAVQSSPYKLYLLIDEYDNFANEIMMSRQEINQQRYESLVYGEGALKTIFKMVKSGTKGLGLDRIFITGVSPVVMSDTFYIMDSESVLERKYSDLTMILRPDMRQYQLLDFLFEFKYVDLKKVNIPGERIRAMSTEELSALSPVQASLKEAKQNLITYRHPLEQRYGKRLRLRVYGVVAVGFERLVWEEVAEGERIRG